ncbi:5'-methylthioadenosine/S-adenosylhomocysteine nucleosidase [Actinomyces sp. F1_1611]
MRVAAVIACAMTEELEPFLARAQHVSEVGGPASSRDHQRFYRAELAQRPVALVLSGIGLVNAAGAATVALAHFSTDRYLLAGTTGGLGTRVQVRDVVAGTRARYFDADATGFGYEPGQIPQMPAEYVGLEAPAFATHAGLVLSGNSFVQADIAEQTRARFPGALAVDMETAAAAQVCYQHGVGWLSLRAVSDLCGPEAGQEFHVGAEVAAELSAQAVERYLAD